MASNVLEEIKACEAKAEELIAEARAEASRILRDAETLAQKQHEEMLQKARQQREQLLAGVRTETEKEILENEKQHTAQADALRKAIEGRLGEAVKTITERIVTVHG